MQAGFSRVSITPPLGTPLVGVGPCVTRRCEDIHDNVYIRALHVADGENQALIMAFDLCFVGRAEADRLKGALGRTLGLRPEQVLLSATHNHVGPMLDSYFDGQYAAPPRDYFSEVEAAVIQAACEARDAAVDVTLKAATARSTLPVNRRRPRDGQIVNAPHPAGPVVDSLPVCLLQDAKGQPVALLFSIATHPSILRGATVSAEYPGVACDLMDAHLGRPCSLFLQGTGGDSKPATIVQDDEWVWKADWSYAERTGRILADEVIAALDQGLEDVSPRLRSALTEARFPLQPAPSRSEYEALLQPGHDDNSRPPVTQEDVTTPALRSRWARRQLDRLNRGTLPAHAPIQVQGIQLGEGLRLVAMEGEPLGAHGRAMEQAFGPGVTFPLGYANGEGIYIVTSGMLDEGGYEPESYWEYGHPAPLAKGIEQVRDQAFATLKQRGIG